MKRKEARKDSRKYDSLVVQFVGQVSSLAVRAIMLLVFAGSLSACSLSSAAGGSVTSMTLPPASETAPTSTNQPMEARTAEHAPTQNGEANNPVLEIPLAGPIADRRSELSGLAWYGDHLIILPQYPNFDRKERGSFLYALPKADILAYLDGQQDQPLAPRPVPLVAAGSSISVPGFEGYEAIAFSGDDAYLTIEARENGDMLGYLIKGRMAPTLEALTLDTSHLSVISPQTDALNIAEESLFVTDQFVGVIHELNGLKVNPAPVIHLFEHDLTPARAIPFPNVPFRITDVTMVDAAGRFWAINYFYPESNELLDVLGGQESNATGDQNWPAWEGMGRLLEFQFSPAGITPAGTTPIQLETSLRDARNWEGLAILDDRGFLLVSDKIPGTSLGFVPLPAAE